MVEPFIAGYAAGETPNPCVGCNGHVRLDAMLELAGRLGCDALATGHYARHRRARRRARPAAAGRRRRGQGPDVHARRARARVARADAVPARHADQAGGQAARGERRTPGRRARPTPRTCASSPAPTAPGSSRVTAGSATARVTSSTAPAAVLGRHRGQHRFTVGQRRGLGIAGGEPLYVLDKDAASGRVTVGPRAALRTTRVPVRGVDLRRAGARVDRVKLRYRSRPIEAGWPGRRRRPPPEARARARAGGRRGRARAARVPDGRRAGGRLGDDRAGYQRDVEVRVADQHQRVGGPVLAVGGAPGVAAARRTRPDCWSRRTCRRSGSRVRGRLAGRGRGRAGCTAPRSRRDDVPGPQRAAAVLAGVDDEVLAAGQRGDLAARSGSRSRSSRSAWR